MTFIGYDKGTKGYMFMRNNNSIYFATQATFFEQWFPQCKDSTKPSEPVLSHPREKHDKRPTNGTDADLPFDLDDDSPDNIPFTMPNEDPKNLSDLPDDYDNLYQDRHEDRGTDNGSQPYHSSQVPSPRTPTPPPKQNNRPPKHFDVYWATEDEDNLHWEPCDKNPCPNRYSLPIEQDYNSTGHHIRISRPATPVVPEPTAAFLRVGRSSNPSSRASPALVPTTIAALSSESESESESDPKPILESESEIELDPTSEMSQNFSLQGLGNLIGQLARQQSELQAVVSTMAGHSKSQRRLDL
ncbi:hypothetical protein GGU11DRAFT_751313 [Lentinula aff. detonsa]|nr:hypothetical protein GGU11DRAFT_751313 [Lentinula aff. detonsa]